MSRLHANRALWPIGAIVSLAFVYVAVRDVDLRSSWQVLTSGRYWLLAPALGVLALGLFLRALRWRSVFVDEHRPPLAPVVDAMLIGYLFNSVLPARAGEAARVVALGQRTRSSRAEVLATVVAERVLDVLALLALLIATAPFVPESTWMGRAVATGAAVFVLLALLFVALALYGERPIELVLRPLSLVPGISRPRLREVAANAVRGLGVFGQPRVALRAGVLTVASWLVIAAAFWLCFGAVRVDASFNAALLVVVATNLSQILPAGPAGIGVFEGVTVLVLAPFDVDRSHALSYAVVAHALNVLPVIVLGYVAIHRHTRALRWARSPAPSRVA